MMKTIQMTIEDSLLEQIDEAVKVLDTTRSAFLRDSAKIRLRKLKFAEMERQHREGYLRHPVQPGEFDGWEDEQVWGDE
jgi:metal-responsive CopG/Arc/MetJ family transcriptional regulator